MGERLIHLGDSNLGAGAIRGTLRGKRREGRGRVVTVKEGREEGRASVRGADTARVARVDSWFHLRPQAARTGFRGASWALILASWPSHPSCSDN